MFCKLLLCFKKQWKDILRFIFHLSNIFTALKYNTVCPLITFEVRAATNEDRLLHQHTNHRNAEQKEKNPNVRFLPYHMLLQRYILLTCYAEGEKRILSLCPTCVCSYFSLWSQVLHGSLLHRLKYIIII